MNHERSVVTTALRRLFGLVVVSVVALLLVQLTAMGDASAQGPIGRPTLTASGEIGGDVTFSWTIDPDATSWQVAEALGTTCDVANAGSVACRRVAGTSGQVCVSVRGVSSSRAGEFSRWVCASGDPFFLGAAGSYVDGQFEFGLTGKGVDLDAFEGSQCAVDLAFLSYRYLCLDTEAALNTAANGIGGATSGTDRVFWLGAEGETPIVDFNPGQLRSNLSALKTVETTAHGRGTPFRISWSVTNRGGQIDALGFGIAIPPILNGVTVTVSPTDTSGGCDQVPRESRSTAARCLLGSIKAGDDPVIVTYSGTIDEDATDEEIDGLRLIGMFDSDTPGDDPSDPEGSNGTDLFDDSMLPDRDIDEDDGFCDGPVTIQLLLACDLPFTVSKPSAGSTSSHPNLVTFDRARYIFHGAGDYVLARSIVDDFEVQVRFGRMSSTTVSFNQAIAARVGDSVISFGDDAVSGAFEPSVVRLDGQVIIPTSSPIDLPGDATIVLTSGQFRVDWSDGTVLRVGLRVADPWTLYPGEPRWGLIDGLLGNADGDRKNDVRSADGTPFDFRSMELYDIFGASWLMDETTTMFESELDANARLPIVPGGVITLADLPPASVERAELLCLAGGVEAGAGLAECIFDVALTGDIRWITGLEFVNDILAQSISLLAERGLIEDDVAATVPGILTGDIGENGAVDLYRFDLEAGAAVTVTASSQCTNSSTFEFALESPSGVFVGRSKGPLCGRLGVFDLPEAGQYILRVYDSNGYTGQYTLHVALPESSQRVYVLDDIASGSIEAGGEGVHTFEVFEDGTELFYDSRGCGLGNQVQLLSAATGVVRDTNCFQEFTEVVDAGVYAVRIYSDDNRGGNYSFRVWDIPERAEPVQLVLDTVVSDRLDFPTDSQEYSFDIAVDGTEVYFDSQGCASGLRWRLIGPDGVAQPFKNCFQGFTEILDAGTWQIRVYSRNDRFGTYSFRAWQIPERQNFDYTLDDSQSGELTFPTDSQEYSFDIAVDGTEVYFDSQGCASGLRWRLVGPDGVAQPFKNCFQGFTGILDAGTWQVRVYSVDDSFGNYSFRAWQIPERQSFDYTLDDSQSGELMFPTDAQEYSFDVVADGTEVYFAPQGCASGLRWRLVGPDGVAQPFKNCFQGFAGILDAGTWQVRVYSVDDRFGTYSFRVWEIPDRENFDYVIGDTINVVLSFPLDSEVYTFDVGADATTLIFDGQGCSPSSQKWQLRRPDGSLVQTRNCFQDMVHTLDAGTHTLRVYTDDDRFGTFQFQVREQ